MGVSLLLSALAFVLHPVQIDTGIDSFRILTGSIPVRAPSPPPSFSLTSQAAHATHCSSHDETNRHPGSWLVV
jgi:hypothetical protein